MPEPGQIPGRYNIVVAEEYDLFDFRVPVEEFREMLREGDVPDEACVVGIEEVFGDEEAIAELSRLMDQRADDLENRAELPTIQIAIEESVQRRQNDYEIRVDDELYRLSRVFGTQIDRRDSGWLTTPF